MEHTFLVLAISYVWEFMALYEAIYVHLCLNNAMSNIVVIIHVPEYYFFFLGSQIGHFHLFQGHSFFFSKGRIIQHFFKTLLNQRNLPLFLCLCSLLSFSSLKCKLDFFHYLFSQM